jgi:diguanylate cyclase (GGDEF)-like protein
MVSIEKDEHVRRARRTAAWTRAAIGLLGIGLLLFKPTLLEHPVFGFVGFGMIVATALLHVSPPHASWLQAEESLAGAAAVLIIGLGNQQVTVLTVLWLAAVASGVMARGGRVHWIGRTVVLAALALPVIREGQLTAEHAGLIVAAIGLLLTIGRLTQELNHLLWQARWDADHDDLTGLLSRAAFRAVLERASAGAKPAEPVSLLLFDLDGFRLVNKTSGHARGDHLLAAFAEVLRGQAGDGVAARLGGDEFALLVPGADAKARGESLLAALPQGDEDTRRISASAGVAQAPRDGSDAEALLRAGDIALRVAKNVTGGGQISVYSGDSLSGHGQHSARGALRRLTEGDGLSMVVQPIVDLRDGSIHAYEALARFGGPGSGGPLEWFSLADELGERDALERACLREALELFCRRPQRARLTVNLSAPVLLDPRTLRMLSQPRDLTGLVIEITEEALVQSAEQLKETIEPLRARGAQLAVDDMGAGYSNLGQIMAVHPSYLKLDRSLITGIDGDRERAELVAALSGYAERVQSLLVAEGMETESELQTLIELGVPLAQGFYLGPKLRANSVPESSAQQRRPRVGPAPRLAAGLG